MSKRFMPAFVAASLLGLCGWALAQHGQPSSEKSDIQGARFAVAPAGNTVVLVETATGKTWVMHGSANDDGSVWLPAARIDDPSEAKKWLNEQQQIKQVLEEDRQKKSEEERRAKLERELSRP